MGGVHLRIKEVGSLVESEVVTCIMERRIKGLETIFSNLIRKGFARPAVVQ